MTEKHYQPNQERLDGFRRVINNPLDRFTIMTNLLLDAAYGARDEDVEIRDAYGPELEAIKQVVGEHYGGELVVPESDEGLEVMLNDCNRAIERLNGTRADNVWDLQADSITILSGFWQKYIRFGEQSNNQDFAGE